MLSWYKRKRQETTVDPNARLTFQYYLIVFLDLLGQRESLRAITRLPGAGEDRTGFIEAIKETVGRILAVRDGFRNYFKSATIHTPDVASIPPQLRDTYRQSLRTAKIEFYGMSDSLVIAVPLMGENENCAAVNGVYAAMVAAAGVHVISLHVGVVLRGGMDVGIGTVIDGRDVYGPALERAVHLEERVAEYPRIVVGDTVLEYLKDIGQQSYVTPLGLVARAVAQRCHRMVSVDADGRPILDFMGPSVIEAAPDVLTPDVFDKALDFVKREHGRFIQEGNKKLAARYARLRSYMEGRRFGQLGTGSL